MANTQRTLLPLLRNAFAGLSMLFAFILSGCGTPGTGSGWPIQTYPSACATSMIPFQPVCLNRSDVEGGFKYQGEFAACRQSVANYTNALKSFGNCSDEKLKAIFDNLLKQVPSTFDCYARYFEVRKAGDPSTECPPIGVPKFYSSYEADGLEFDLGVPRCIRKSDGYSFAPKTTYQLDDCRNQVQVFMGKTFFARSMNASSAQEQYDTYLRNLNRVLDAKSNDAISKFNCIAERRTYC